MSDSTPVKPGEPARPRKSAQTRERVRGAAFASLRTHGYDGATMRAIAAEAGIAPGGIYYYYASKDDIVRDLYDDVSERFRVEGLHALEGVTSLEDRLLTVFRIGFDLVAPYHGFAAQFVGTAITPGEGTNPFGDDAGPARAAVVSLFRTVVEGSRLTVADDVRDELPELLWGLFMAGMLFWSYDTSDGQERTTELYTQVVPLVVSLLAVSRLPFLKKQTAQALQIVRLVKGVGND